MQLPLGIGIAAIGGIDKGQRFNQVRRDLAQDGLLVAGLPNHADPPLREVADAAMQQAAGTAAGAEGEVVLAGSLPFGIGLNIQLSSIGCKVNSIKGRVE